MVQGMFISSPFSVIACHEASWYVDLFSQIINPINKAI